MQELGFDEQVRGQVVLEVWTTWKVMMTTGNEESRIYIGSMVLVRKDWVLLA